MYLLGLLITLPLIVQDPSNFSIANGSSDAQILLEVRVYICLGSYVILHTKVRSPTPSQNYHKFISKLRQSHFKAYDNRTTGNSGGPIHTAGAVLTKTKSRYINCLAYLAFIWLCCSPTSQYSDNMMTLPIVRKPRKYSDKMLQTFFVVVNFHLRLQRRDM